MKNTKLFLMLLPVYLSVSLFLLLGSFIGSKFTTVISQNTPIIDRKCLIIDAGHGGVDGGAVSCTGVLESHLNLEIALRLDDLCHLLGIHTKMIRTTDCSVYTQGNTISEKKISDLKERVRIINESENAILVSIHQNKYTESRYSGAQVFYAETEGSKNLANEIQSLYVNSINSDCHRNIKKSDSVYLMKHISCPGVLIECGFLSNPEEEALLRNPTYQQKLCCVIASACSRYLTKA